MRANGAVHASHNRVPVSQAAGAEWAFFNSQPSILYKDTLGGGHSAHVRHVRVELAVAERRLPRLVANTGGVTMTTFDVFYSVLLPAPLARAP